MEGEKAGTIGGARPTKTSRSEQLLGRNVQRSRGGLVCKAHRLVYHSTLGLTVIKRKKKKTSRCPLPSQDGKSQKVLRGFT